MGVLVAGTAVRRSSLLVIAVAALLIAAKIVAWLLTGSVSVLSSLLDSLLDIAMNNGFHLEHACGGNCACTTCHVVVKQGEQNLSEMEDDEFDRVEQASDFQLNSRLGCQAIVKGDVTVHIPAWNRNYVSEGH